MIDVNYLPLVRKRTHEVTFAQWGNLLFFSMLFLSGSILAATESHKDLLSRGVISLDGNDWLLGIDPGNVGREQRWFDTPANNAKRTKVPWVIQDIFSDYHGVAWYWHSFVAPGNPDKNGRYLLRFWAVDYKADVWVNGVSVGGHEGGETPFVLDVTRAIKPRAINLIAVRVLNPGNERIDGIVLQETPHRNKTTAFSSGPDYNHGGIEDSVELFTAPATRVQNIFVRANPTTRIISVE